MNIAWRQWLTLLEGCLLVALGVRLLQSSELLVSGTAGLSLLLSDLGPLSFGLTFFLINLPFYGLALSQLGRDFTLRTLCCVTLLSVLSDVLTIALPLGNTSAPVCAVAAGLLIGLGLALLFRANASLGGLNILALYLERRAGWHAGRTTLFCDLLLLTLAFSIYPLSQVAGSALAFVTLSIVLGRYHRNSTVSRQAEERVPRHKGALSPHRASATRIRNWNVEG
ncbi:YitT family protein [Halomonas shantousis]